MNARKATSTFTRLLISDPRAVAELFEAQWAVLRARLDRSSKPIGHLVEYGAANSHQGLTGTSRRSVTRITAAMDRVARFGLIRPTCLEYAMAVQWLLKRRKIGPGIIRVGVQIRDGAFTAHAWLQLGDLVLGDSQSRVDRFQHLTDVKAFRL